MTKGVDRLVVARQSVSEDRNERKQPGGQSERREQNLVAGEQGDEKDAKETEQGQQIEQRPGSGHEPHAFIGEDGNAGDVAQGMLDDVVEGLSLHPRRPVALISFSFDALVEGRAPVRFRRGCLREPSPGFRSSSL